MIFQIDKSILLTTMCNDIEERYGYCDVVDRDVLHTRKRVKKNWPLILFQLVITGGLWSLFIVHNISSSAAWRCTVCGRKHY